MSASTGEIFFLKKVEWRLHVVAMVTVGRDVGIGQNDAADGAVLGVHHVGRVLMGAGGLSRSDQSDKSDQTD